MSTLLVLIVSVWLLTSFYLHPQLFLNGVKVLRCCSTIPSAISSSYMFVELFRFNRRLSEGRAPPLLTPSDDPSPSTVLFPCFVVVYSINFQVALRSIAFSYGLWVRYQNIVLELNSCMILILRCATYWYIQNIVLEPTSCTIRRLRCVAFRTGYTAALVDHFRFFVDSYLLTNFHNCNST